MDCTVGPSSERRAYCTLSLCLRAYARNVRLYYPRIGSTPIFFYLFLFPSSSGWVEEIISTVSEVLGHTFFCLNLFLFSIMSHCLIAIFNYYPTRDTRVCSFGRQPRR